MVTFSPTLLKDAFIIDPKVFNDDRGYFFESFRKNLFDDLHISDFVQENESLSSYGVIRGLHFQKNPHAQSKLVRVVRGRILDVIVDLRQASPTFGKWISVELSSENKRQLFIPRGFAHGFSVLSEKTLVMYKCDNYYHKESEGGILYNDPSLAISWKVNEENAILSPKDLQLSTFSAYKEKPCF